METVLITCAGSGVGQSVIDSLLLTDRYRIFGCDTNRNIYAFHFCERFFIVPSFYSDEYLDSLLDLCLKEGIDLIIPGHDHELLILSKNVTKFEEKGIKIIVSKPDLIEVSRDKLKWSEYFAEYGCPIVPTFKVEDFKKNPDPTIFPAIVKPSGGSASQGILILNDINELQEAKDSDIIQPYLFPRSDDENFELIQKNVKSGRFVQYSEISIQIIFTELSEFAGIFISKNILKNGVPVFVDPILPENFEFIGDIMKFVPVCAEKGVKGPVNIQGRITDKGLICFEMNMRFTGITGNRAQLGFNEVDFLVDNFLGKNCKLNGYASNKYGVRQVACTTIPRAGLNSLKKTYAILGAGGFIGTHFVNELLKRNDYKKIFLLCREESFQKYKSSFIAENIEIIIDSDKYIETAYCQTDVVVNFAGALANKSDLDIYNSIIFQHNQVQKIINSKVPLVINISSQSVYDQNLDIAKDEIHPVRIDNLYGFQKFLTEKFYETISSYSPSITAISLRLPRIIGPHKDLKTNGFFLKVIESVKKNTIIEIPFPENKTTLLDVRDAVDVIIHLINYKNYNQLPKVINITGTDLTIAEYCQKVLQSFGLGNKNDLIIRSDNKEVKANSVIKSIFLEKINWGNKYSIEDTIKAIAEQIKI